MNRITVANVVSMSVVVCAFVPLFVRTLGTVTAGLAILALAVESMKVLVGSNSSWSRRPAGASDCGLWCAEGAVGGTPGWPSGHMAVATALVVFFLVRNRDRERTKWAVGIGIGWLAMVAWARWVKRCHTQGQIVAGGVVGCVGGLGLAWALR